MAGHGGVQGLTVSEGQSQDAKAGLLCGDWALLSLLADFPGRCLRVMVPAVIAVGDLGHISPLL